jgi:hypothetical protein
MDIVVLGIDLGKNVCSLVGLGNGPRAWWRWKRAAALIIWGGNWRRRGTRFG